MMRRLVIFSSCLAALLVAFNSVAATSTWNINSGGLWSIPGNWSGSVPGSPGDTASLTKNLTAARIITNDVSDSVGTLNIGDSGSSYFAYTLTNNSGITFTFDNNGSGALLSQSSTTASDVIATPVTLNDNLKINNASSSGTVVISGNISGTGNILKYGAGTLTLSGSNFFSGSITVTNGTVKVYGNQTGATGSWLMPVNYATTTVNFEPGSTMLVSAINLIQVGSYPSNGTPNNQTINAYGVMTNNGPLFVARGAYLNINAGAIWIQNGSLTNTPPGGSGYSAAITVNSGGMFAYNGTNPIIMTPSLGNGGDGTLTINGGTFSTSQGFVDPVILGASWGYAQIILSSGGTLALSANIPQLTAGLNTNGTPLINLSGTGGAIDTSSFSTTITNVIGGSGALTKLGSGTLTLAAPNIYSGVTTVSNGTLVLQNAGTIAGSSMIIVAGTGATLQISQTGALTNNALLVVNPGGTIALGSGVNQSVGALYLGGQWESDGTWGSSASAAANKNDTYFSGPGVITLAHSGSQILTPSFISTWYTRYYGGSYDNHNPDPGVIAYMPYPGWDYVPNSSVNINSYNYQLTNNLPLAVYFLEGSAPVGDNTNTIGGTYMRSNAVMDTVTFFTTNTTPVYPLNYVLSDFEPYDQTLAHCELEITNMVNLVRASPNTNVSSAFVGNYACYAGGTDALMSPSGRIGTDSFYRNSGLNVAQPNAYPYSSYTNNGPNARSGLFWSDVELVSFAKINLPGGHRLFPWLDNSLTGDPAGVPTIDDCVALIAHVRLRGADGFCDLGGLTNVMYGWTDLDWLFHGLGGPQIFNLTTSEANGFQWSGFRVGDNLAFMFSNLGNADTSTNLPYFPGLPTSTPTVPAGTHVAWYFVNDASTIATNQINLGRNGINHSLFLNGSFTLTNAIQVTDPGTGVVAAVTIGSWATNNFTTVLAGSLILSNNVALQGYGSNLIVVGIISGSGGTTNLGYVTFAAANNYTGPTTVGPGTLQVNGSLAAASAVTVVAGGVLSGTGTVSGTVTLSGTIVPGATGVGTLTTADETWNGGAACLFRMAKATNNSGRSLLNINGALNIAASAGSPFTISLASLGANNLGGPAAGFSTYSNYAWTIATASAGIVNFDPTAFAVDTSGFSNAFNGTFSVTTNGNSLVLDYVAAVPPVLNNSSTAANGSFAFSFSGSAGSNFRVLASTNLLLPLTNWWVLTNGVFGAGSMNYTDATATNLQEFYRIVSP